MRIGEVEDDEDIKRREKRREKREKEERKRRKKEQKNRKMQSSGSSKDGRFEHTHSTSLLAAIDEGEEHDDEDDSSEDSDDDIPSVTYQASSPDEVALVKFSESVGLTLSERELNWMRITTPSGGSLVYDILEIFPFSSVTKRMAIVVRARDTGKILIIVKGADSVIQSMIRSEGSEWLSENVDGMARDGLRTLVFAEKEVEEEEWSRWKVMYDEAKASVVDRKERVLRVENELLQNMTLLSISGVEDLLQQNVRTSLESLRKAGIKVWMLTGDKVETAKCIARSTSLVDRTQGFSQIIGKDEDAIRRKLKQHIKNGDGNCLVVDGNTLLVALADYPADGRVSDAGCCSGIPQNGPGSLGGGDSLGELLIETACAAPCVVCCRVSPNQKAQMVNLAKKYTGLQTAAIGDGGNDVSMIQAADLGLGLVGKEGKQAAMASDFSIDKFYYVLRLLFWHGRNCYTRGAHMTQFVCARGLVISILQAVFSALFYFSSMSLFSGFLLMGYSVFYTSLPVFAMCFDYDVDSNKVLLYPELYKEVARGKVMSKKTFGIWIINSIYQGGAIMILTIILFHQNFYSVVGISFTALILIELLTLLFTVHHWTWQMIVTEILSVILYFGSLFLLKSYFDWTFMMRWPFWWRVIIITLIAYLPVRLAQWINEKWVNPPMQTKLK
ncbi:Probable phospholipid-transporting ATPase IIB [Aduncisulcus paluster]|nr:Probable phospholipid-transporting ATPase IIB [Aduncisulcus paluster]